MTQTKILTWCQAIQSKLMDALDAAWAILEASNDPEEIKRARDRAKACGDLAAQVRKVALAAPMPRGGKAFAMEPAGPEGFAAPAPTQADHARRALEKLKGGRRGRV
ncbi:MAG: hypothetical protein J7521_06620 [Caulobacter sp.]|nr:hypothetical protein [Caulobacter sp.]